jgi:hypothetical protein
MDAFNAIDWQQPWYKPWADVGQEVTKVVVCANGVGQRASLPVYAALNHVAQARQIACPRFMPQASLTQGQAYESHVSAHWECPTRDNLHDFFNGLCWLKFPQTKARLNQLQTEQIQRDGVQARRGPVRDAITLMDESAALLSAPEPLWQALIAKDWQSLFIALRPLWADATLLLLGHASLERLVSPRKPMVSHVYRAKLAINFGEMSMPELDHAVALDLDANHLRGKPFAPLPLMGVPGWCAANAAPSFYDDTHVFRVPTS